ncbi:MAG: AAA-like domain-containing protein, partial [Actinomycetota bacterium]
FSVSELKSFVNLTPFSFFLYSPLFYTSLLKRVQFILHDYLASAYHEVLTKNQCNLKTNLTFKLESMGLVKVEKDDCLPRCGLYQQYFSKRLQPEL